MKALKIIGICIIFLLGFTSANCLNYINYSVEFPYLNSLGIGISDNNSVAPSDFVKENQIHIYDDRIVIDIEGASLSQYAPTRSMIPVLDEGSNGIRIVPDSEQEIHVGDIITFKQDNHYIVHRVIEKGRDNKGVYFIAKGDNNNVSDGKVRFSDIKYKTIGVIW